MSLKRVTLTLFLSLLLGATVAAAQTPAPTVIVVDSSGSMAAQLDGEARLDTARRALAELLAQWPADAPVGLIAYGHRRTGDCADIEELVPIGPPDAAAVVKRLGELRARGKTPLSASLEQAAGLLAAQGSGGSIILLTDGIETCNAEPCAVAAALRAADAALTIHVVGFAIEEKDRAALACIAENGAGLYRSADDAAALLASLGETAQAAAEPEPAQPPPPAPPPPEPPKPVLVHLVAVLAPDGTVVQWPVAWDLERQGEGEPFAYAGESRGLALELLPGSYEVQARASNVAGSVTFEVGEEESTVEVPLGAGLLAARAVPYKGAEPLKDGLSWTIEPLEGQGSVTGSELARPSFLLAPGKYRLTVEGGDRRAQSELVVEAGRSLESELSFRLGELTLIAAIGEEAAPLTDWRGLAWRARQADGSLAAEQSNVASPLFQLPAGAYRFELAMAGTTVGQDFAIEEGTSREERFVVPTGNRSFLAALGPTAEPFTDWRDARWTVTAIDAIGVEPGTLLLDRHAAANPSVALLPGRWEVEVVSDWAGAETEITVAPESDATVRLDVNAGRVTIVAKPAEGAEEPMNVVFEVVPLPDGERFSLGGASESWSAILPAGKWRVIATDSFYRSAETEIELKAGEERTLDLLLQ
jgi:Ca-activated chloride channel family protein